MLGAELVALAADSVLELDSELLLSDVEEAEELLLDEALVTVLLLVIVEVPEELVEVTVVDALFEEEPEVEEPDDEALALVAEATPLAATETPQ